MNFYFLQIAQSQVFCYRNRNSQNIGYPSLGESCLISLATIPGSFQGLELWCELRLMFAEGVLVCESHPWWAGSGEGCKIISWSPDLYFNHICRMPWTTSETDPWALCRTPQTLTIRGPSLKKRTHSKATVEHSLVLSCNWETWWNWVQLTWLAGEALVLPRWGILCFCHPGTISLLWMQLGCPGSSPNPAAYQICDLGEFI